MLYEGIFALCFSYGHLGHTQDKCCYNIKQGEKHDEGGEASKVQEASQDAQSSPNYGPWMLVTRKRNSICNGQGITSIKSNSGLEG